MPATRLLMVALLAAAALVAGCEARMPAQAKGHDVVRPQLGFAINVPAGWTFHDLYGDVVLEILPQGPAAEAPAAAPAAPAPKAHTDHTTEVINVVVVDREGMTPDTWADQQLAEAKELQPALEVMKREPAKLADGRDAILLELKNPRAVRPLVQKMLLTVTSHRAYAVLATAPESDFPSLDGPAGKCFNSLVVW
jgi:hypothetical protein